LTQVAAKPICPGHIILLLPGQNSVGAGELLQVLSQTCLCKPVLHLPSSADCSDVLHTVCTHLLCWNPAWFFWPS